MTKDLSAVKTVAPLRNVTAFNELVDRVVERTMGLPGMACFYGPSGYGKTFAAIYAANRHRAYHVQVKSVWTRKFFCQAVLRDMGIAPARTIPEMTDQIGDQLTQSGRPLIIDEADILAAKGIIEVVRDIYESCFAAILLIGEENLPAVLKNSERIHGRMLDWVPAQAATIEDARHLAGYYCRGITVQDDLMEALKAASGSSIRRICVNLDRVREHAQKFSMREIGRADYPGLFFTGAPPNRRDP